MDTRLKRFTLLLAAALAAAPIVAAPVALGQRAGGPTLTPSTPSPILDGMTPVFWLAGSDPTVAPGLDLPIGSIARTSPSSAGPFYFAKVGFAPTEWQIVQGQAPGVSGAPLLVSGAAGTRYYCADYDNGSDSRRGYVDAQTGTTLTTCAANAVKTLSRLRTIVPPYGNGRSIVLLIKPRAAGATYRNPANTADDGLDLSALAGYAYIGVRGSDLTNSAADHITVGAIQPVTGPGAGGAYTVAAGGTTSVFSVSSGSFGATDAIVGYRWRFDVATTTAALRNVACFISANTGTAITCGSNLGTAPAIGDLGYVEQPGVRMAYFRGANNTGALTSGATYAALHSQALGGIAITGSAQASLLLGTAASAVRATFIETTASTTNAVTTFNTNAAGLEILTSYPDETGTSRTLGAGLRSAGALTGVAGPQVLFISHSAFVNASAAVTIFGALEFSIGSGGSYFAKGPTITAAVVANTATYPGQFGTTSATQRATRVIAGPLTLSGSIRVQSADVSGSGSSGIILNPVATGLGGGSFSFTTVTGTGNTTFGIDASALVASSVKIASDSTITGTSGDLKLAGAAAAAIADLSLTNVIDNAGNNIQGAAGAVVGQATLVSNQSGGALAVGHVVRTNGTTGQVTCLQGDTAAHSKVAAGVMVTAPASAAVGYMVATGAPYVLYDGAPTVGAQVFASTGTTCKATTTLPAAAATNQCLSLGANLTASASTGYTAFHPSQLPIVATGAACR